MLFHRLFYLTIISLINIGISYLRKAMKYIPLILVVLAAGCASTEKTNIPEKSNASKPITIYTNDKKGIESLMSNKALKSYKTDYAKASKHKAFAQSASGAWNWKSNRTSKEHAMTGALIGCQRNNKKSEDLYPCKVINVDGKWLNE